MTASKLLMAFIPLVPASLAFYGFLRWRAKNRRLHFVDGLLGWIVFVAAAFVGQFIGYILFPGMYARFGDYPTQVSGLMNVLFLSLIFCPAVWFSLRRKKRLLVLLAFLIPVSALSATVKGEIFRGGFTFLSGNYFPATLNYEINGTEAEVSLTPLNESECVFSFEKGTIVSFESFPFSKKTRYHYLLPVIESCGHKNQPLFFELTLNDEGTPLSARIHFMNHAAYFTERY